MDREFILFAYFTLLCVLSIYGFHRYQLIYLFYKYKKKYPSQPAPEIGEAAPRHYPVADLQ
jgi:hypothetical protein